MSALSGAMIRSAVCAFEVCTALYLTAEKNKAFHIAGLPVCKHCSLKHKLVTAISLHTDSGFNSNAIVELSSII